MQGLRRQTQGGASKSQWTKSDEGTSMEMRQQGAGERELLGEGETKETAAFLKTWCVLWYLFGFPRGARGKEPICQCRRLKRCEFSGWGRSPGRGHGNPLQYFCLEDPMDRGAWQATVHRGAKSQTQLKQLRTHTRNPAHCGKILTNNGGQIIPM